MTTVSVSMNMWPGSDELPLPTQLEQAGPVTRAQGGRAALPRDAFATDVTQGMGVGAVTSVDPWDLWPTLDPLPVPAQVLPSASSSEEAESQVAGGTPARDDGGATPTELGLAAIFATALGVLGGTRRGRRFVLGFTARLHRLLTRPLWPTRFSRPSLARQAARGLALLRLTLGTLRFW
jgi:hypothetical protein